MPHESQMTTPADIQTLLDRERIRNIILQAARATDRADLELFRNCFHVDAWADYGYYKGPATNFTPGSIARPPHIKNVMHAISNVLIDIESDRAWSEAYYVAYQRTIEDAAEKDTTFGGRYIDRFECRSGEWRIAYRTVIYDWNRVDMVTQTVAVPGAVQGCASRNDPSYERTSR